VTALWAVFLILIGSPEAMLFTTPALLLASFLALGRYVGEDLIEDLRAAIRRPVDPEVWSQDRLPNPTNEAIRSSRIIALNLAGRAPPLAAA
jgi:hypothetical protein